MKKLLIIVFILIGILISVGVKAQNLISISSFSMPKSVPANTSDWGNLNGLMVLANASQPDNTMILKDSKVTFTIKSGGNKVCGGNLVASGFMNSSRIFRSSEIGAMFNGFVLKPGTYEICLQFYFSDNGRTKPISDEKCSIGQFVIDEAGGSTNRTNASYTLPQNFRPANEKLYTENELKGPLTFKWTPLLPIPKMPTRYKLMVWQVNEGQNEAHAMNSNSPLINEEVIGQTQYLYRNGLNGLTNGTYVWRVQASDELGRALGISEQTRFIVGKKILRNDSIVAVMKPVRVSKQSIELLEKSRVDKNGNEKSSVCLNGDVEQNSYENWDFSIGNYNGYNVFGANNINSGLSLTIADPNTSEPRIFIESQGQDPNIGSLSKVLEGTKSLRIGNNDPDAQGGTRSERASYSFTVNNSNKIFKYNYAFVVQDGKHSKRQQSFFWARIMAGKKVVCETKRILPTDDGFDKQGTFTYRNWNCVTCDLSDYVGENVKAEFTVSGCSVGGHKAYAYIDGLCSQNPMNLDFTLNKSIYCKQDDIIMDASATVGATNFWLTVEESDANWGRPNPQSELIMLFAGQTPNSNMNVSTFLNLFGYQLKCNTYYRVKLAANNKCVSWNEKTELIYITCPEVDITALHCVSCKNQIGSPLQIPIGTTNGNNYQYSWSPNTGLNNYTSSNPIFTYNNAPLPITYRVLITDNNGCEISREVKINRPPCWVQISQRAANDCCGGTILSIGDGQYPSVIWSTGQSGINAITVTEPGTYSVTVSNECGSYTQSISITSTNTTQYPRYYTNLNDVSNHHFYSSHNNNNSLHKFFITNVETLEPAYGEYYATHFKLEIYNRWGERFRTDSGQITSCQGFSNPGIFWDGKTIQGVNVQEGLYNGRLYLKNCAQTNWREVKVTIPQTSCTEGTGKCKWRLTWNRDYQCGPNKWQKCKSGAWVPSQSQEYVFPIYIFW